MRKVYLYKGNIVFRSLQIICIPCWLPNKYRKESPNKVPLLVIEEKNSPVKGCSGLTNMSNIKMSKKCYAYVNLSKSQGVEVSKQIINLQTELNYLNKVKICFVLNDLT